MICVRSMTRADIPAAAALENACFSTPWSADAFASAFDAGATFFFLAESDGQPIGYCGVQVLPPDAAVTNVAVAPAYRRIGVGGRLIGAMLAFCAARGAVALTLEVRTSNAAAIALYEKMGFVPLGRRKRFYAAPAEDALVMRYAMGGA